MTADPATPMIEDMVAAAWWQVRKLESFTQNHPRRHDAPPGPDLAERELAVWRAVHATLSTLSPLIEAARAQAIDEAARIVEGGSETHRANQEDGGYLSRRSPGDIAGLAYAAAIRALSIFPAPVSQWRPISEAPPVEEPYKRLNLLLWWPHWNKERPILGHLSPFGWRADEALSADGVDPTHWMPLPAPPDTSDGGK